MFSLSALKPHGALHRSYRIPTPVKHCQAAETLDVLRGLINVTNREKHVRSRDKARKRRHAESTSQAGMKGQEAGSMAFPHYFYSLLKFIPVQARYLLLLP